MFSNDKVLIVFEKLNSTLTKSARDAYEINNMVSQVKLFKTQISKINSYFEDLESSVDKLIEQFDYFLKLNRRDDFLM
eukprot:Pgem_evm1s5955